MSLFFNFIIIYCCFFQEEVKDNEIEKLKEKAPDTITNYIKTDNSEYIPWRSIENKSKMPFHDTTPHNDTIKKVLLNLF